MSQTPKKARRKIKKEIQPKLILVSIFTFFFVLYEYATIQVLSRLIFLGLTLIIFWQMGSFAVYLHLTYLLYKNRIVRMLMAVIFSLISIIALVLLYKVLSLVILKVILTAVLFFSLRAFYLQIRYFKRSKSRIDFRGAFMLTLLSMFFFVSISTLTLPTQKITITPQSKPELIFYTDPYRIPTSNSTLQKYAENGVSFMPAIGPWTLKKDSLMERYKLAIQNKVNLYFCLLSSNADFANIDNVHEFIDIYKEFKQWFTDEGIFESPYIKSFCLDAEPPIALVKELQQKDVFDGLNYLIEGFPTKENVSDSTDSLADLIDLIHSDGKTAGIIRTLNNFDENDGDGDIELLSKNIYTLNVKWDFSISMIYRSQRMGKTKAGSINEIVNNLLLNAYGATKTADKIVYSRYYFYYYVGFAKTAQDLKADNKYIFLGNYIEEFELTTYIKDKEFLYDLDVCRHFGEEKVFLYDYGGFTYHYGEDGINMIIEHNNQHESWDLEYQSYETVAHTFVLIGTVIVDKLLFLELTSS